MLRNIRLFKGPLISILCAAAEVSNLHQICTVPPTEGGLLAFFLGLDLLLLLGGRLLFGRGLKLRRLCCFRL
jgi:hypothetical protein